MLQRRVRAHQRLLPLLVLGCGFGIGFGSACVHVYQPLSRLSEPAILPFAEDNFKNLMVETSCSTQTSDWEDEAIEACYFIEGVLEEQGASFPTTESREVADLVVQLRSVRLSEENNNWMWFPFFFSFSLYPLRTSFTFALEVTIYDRDQTTLAREMMQGRFTEITGLGYWGLNLLANLLLRDGQEEISEDRSSLQFSADLGNRISQLVYQANVNQKLRQRASQGRRPSNTENPQPLENDRNPSNREGN